MSKRRVVVTGLGIVSPFGVGVEKFWNSLLEGKSGISTIENITLEGHTVHIAGEIKDFKHIGIANNKGGVFSFQVANIHPQDLDYVLNKEGVCIRIGHHCAEPLVNRMGYPSLARASFALYTTKEDIDAFVTAVNKAVKFF